MSDSLRDALEQLADDFDGKQQGGALAYSAATRILRSVLRDHPVEPAPRCLCGTPGINYAGPERDCPIHGEPAGVSDEAVEAGARALGGHRFDGFADRSKRALRDEARAVLEAALPYLHAQPVASRERVAEALYLHDHRNPLVAPARWDKAMTLSRRQYLMRADALLAAGVFREEAECGAVDRTGQRRCVFAPGHHEGDAWTSHADRGGWTWNDQPADVLP